MEKNKTNAASGIEKERELTAEELEKVLGGVMDTQQMGEKTTASTVLTQLMDRNGKAMEIEDTDNVTM